MITELFNYYKEIYKTEWLPNGDIDSYNKKVKKEERLGFAIYFSKKEKEYAITIDTELVCILKRKRMIFTNKTYWVQINHIHLNDYPKEISKDKVMEVVAVYLK